MDREKYSLALKTFSMLPNRWAKRLKIQESAQRSLCRLGFLTLALAPMFFILFHWAWSIAPWSRDWAARDLEKRISLHLGLDVRLESVQHFAPNSYRLQKVRITHSETKVLLAEIPSVEFYQHTNAWNLRLHSPVVELSQASLLGNAIHHRYLCQPNLSFPITKYSIRHLIVRNGTLAMQPIFLEGILRCDRSKSTFQAYFDLASTLATSDGSRSASLDVERIHDALSPNSDAVAPSTRWLLQTRDFKLPCTALAAFYDVGTQLDPAAFFQGDIHCTNGRLVTADGLVSTQSGWKCTLSQWLAAILPRLQAVQTASHVEAAAGLRPASNGYLER